MIYYLVGLLDKRSYKAVEKIQKYLSDKFDLYTDLPVLHVTLEVITDPDMNNLLPVLDNILRKYNKFSINIDGAICFNPPYKSVNLKVEKNNYIMNLILDINSTLKSNKFSVRENIDDWDLHISLANPYFAKRDWSEEDFSNACIIAHENNFQKTGQITKIQLWKPVNNKDSMVVQSFDLYPNF
ncbi:2'-5' RNA ligase family protein [Clostridium sp. MB40-C1]|uniref:2'-5' RNA ligase family protein n=1 Tax=Clostridium sp. MB40-C1 TaxID=3070996 RepID=UPI0027E16927|nr:2'-5' RNA ligase family protein [Clostridium sp. MB40-C1]WMJ81883.1 2'-5' RNA ligase family protein [Clostridium sp. MB40-C1]